MMRTTIRLDPGLLIEAKRHALETRRSFTELVRDALVATLESERGKASPRRVKLPTFKGEGVADGIDIDNTASLLDRMELER